jgi:hypothetical protein
MAVERRTRKRLTPALVVGAALALVVVAAWGMQAAVTHKAGAGEQGSPAPAYSITVELGGKVLKEYDLAALHALPQTRVVIDGKEQDGPSLQAVLSDAGVAAYADVSVKGQALRDAGHVQLSAAAVGQGVMLDFSDRGTVKVCGATLDRSAWVRDVLTIAAE